MLLESNPPREAAQLLKRFDISVDSAWASEVAQIHRDLVGTDCRITTRLSFVITATSNQPMQPTAGRRTTSPQNMKTSFLLSLAFSPAAADLVLVRVMRRACFFKNFLFVAQGNNWINANSAPCRNPAGQKSDAG